ncbi:MAG: PucR family transcriptional regulator [Anaerovoracaceae bacterium]|nr:PucR family transcriptional regulator [Anaerovoracaceae bacterium]
MKATVRDCLRLDVFRQCVVVAGEKNLNNRVKRVSVMDALTANEAALYNARPEELVLTTFSGMKDDDAARRETIRELARGNVAGLVIFQRENTAYDHSYKEVIETAEETGLPLMILAGSAANDYADVIASVMEQVLYGDNFQNSLINNTIFHLLNFEKHTGFEKALKEAAISNDFQVVLLSEDFNPVLAVETRHRLAIDEAIRKGRETAMNLGRVYSLIDIEGVQTYWGSVEVDGEKYFLLIVDNEDNYSSGEITKLAEIIELAMGMWKFTPERDARAEFVKVLIRENRSLAYSLKEEAGVNPRDIISVFFARGADNVMWDSVMDGYEEKGMLRIMKINEEDETYGIIMAGQSAEKEGEAGSKALCLKLFDELKEDKSVRIFHITGLDAIEGACDGFHMINETWDFAGGIFPYKRVFTKYELTLVSNCINIQIQGGYLKKNFLDLMMPFRIEGGNKARQLLDTLETFVLDAGMNSSKTAEFMGIHTNTVQYRLKKINEILGAEITGNRVIPGLTIALALQRLESSGK